MLHSYGSCHRLPEKHNTVPAPAARLLELVDGLGLVRGGTPPIRNATARSIAVLERTMLGGGKSYTRGLSADQVTMAHVVADLVELSERLPQRGWVRSLGLVTHERKFAMELGRAIAMNPEVTVRDPYFLFARLRWNMELLWPEFCRVDLAREIPARSSSPSPVRATSPASRSRGGSWRSCCASRRCSRPRAYTRPREEHRTMPEADPPTSAHLILYVRDQERARAFYQAALGFAPRLHVPGMTEFELVRGAVLGLMPEAGIRRLLPALPDPAAARGVPRAEAYLVVASPAAALARALAAGATELSPVLPRDWGDDAGYCLDPDGHVLAFAALSRGSDSVHDGPAAGGPAAGGPGTGGLAADAASAVDLRPFDPGCDLALVALWAERPDVRRWWGDPGVALADLVDRPPGSAAMVAWGGRLVGVLCWQRPTRAELEEAGLTDLPAGLVDVDVLIGDPEARGRGLAAAALRRLCERLRDQGVRWVGLATATANASALAAYAKAGFAPYRDFVENGEGYRYFTRELASGG